MALCVHDSNIVTLLSTECRSSVLTATLQSSAICCEEFTIYGKRVHCTIYMYPLPVGNRQVCIYVMLPSPKCS